MADKELKNVWRGMVWRCNNPSNRKIYSNIGVCKRWLDYQNFYDDMHRGYKKGLSIDRIDNLGDYSPDNCRWVTSKVQANKRSTNRYLTYGGRTMTVAEWADCLDIKYSTFKQRFYVYRWPLSRLIGDYLG